jgi:hypothetical protein
MARRIAQLLTAHPAERSGSLSGQVNPPTGITIRRAEVPAELIAPPPDGFDGHFFDDLATGSTVMSRFCARVKKRADMPSVSMTDIYRHPTISRPTLALTEVAGAPVEPALPPPTRLHTHRYLLCETFQLLIFLGYTYLGAVMAIQSSQWIFAGSGLLETYRRSVLPREVLVGMADPRRLAAVEVTAK